VDSPSLPLEAHEGLLRRFAAGESAACRTVERWAREIVLFQRLGLTREDREDIVQEVVSAVWSAASRPDFAVRRTLRAFVRTVTLARAIDRVRRRRRLVPAEDTLPDPGPGPTEGAERTEDALRLYDALDTLDVRCREIIRLHYFEDWPYARIAAQEGRSEATMRVRMFHCIRTLRARIPSG
jgi:RNA polymerase sigma factor (sigma-70 family)